MDYKARFNIRNEIKKLTISSRNGNIEFNDNNIKSKYLTKGFVGQIYQYEYKNIKFIIKKQPNNDKAINEYTLLNFMSNIVASKISPNFIISYGNYITNEYNYIIMEKMEGTLNDFLDNYHNNMEWESFLFQFLIALYVTHSYGKIYHGDLGENNIFYHRLNNKEKYFCYKLTVPEGQYNFVLNHKKILFTISDFDKSKSVLTVNDPVQQEKILNEINNLSDLRRLSEMIQRIYVSYMIQQFSIDQLIDIIKKNKDDQFDKYLLKEKQKLISYKLPGKNINKLIKKSICYYILENNYLSPESLNQIGKKLPSLEIINLMNNIFKSEKKSLVKIIINNFSHLIKTDDNLPETDNILDTFIL